MEENTKKQEEVQDQTEEQEESSEEDKKIRHLAEERDAYLNSWKRAKADLINYQQEESKRLEEIAKFSSQGLIKEIISVISNLALAIKALEQSKNSQEEVNKGIHMIKSQLEDILKRNGVERINAKVGSKFDPMYHEAIGVVSASEIDSKLNSGEIAEEVEVGYTMHGKVIQVAKVRVVE